MRARIRPGERLPLVRFSELSEGMLTHLGVDELFLGRRALLIGMPGAFTPICNDTHLPSLVAKADQLKNSGFDMIACVTSNDPWIMHAWATQQDPEHKLLPGRTRAAVCDGDPGQRCRKAACRSHSARSDMLRGDALLGEITETRMRNGNRSKAP